MMTWGGEGGSEHFWWWRNLWTVPKHHPAFFSLVHFFFVMLCFTSFVFLYLGDQKCQVFCPHCIWIRQRVYRKRFSCQDFYFENKLWATLRLRIQTNSFFYSQERKNNNAKFLGTYIFFPQKNEILAKILGYLKMPLHVLLINWHALWRNGTDSKCIWTPTEFLRLLQAMAKHITTFYYVLLLKTANFTARLFPPGYKGRRSALKWEASWTFLISADFFCKFF